MAPPRPPLTGAGVPWRGLTLAAALVAAVPAVAVVAQLTGMRWAPHWPAAKAVLWMIVIAPLIEETVFRGGLQEWLLRCTAHAIGSLSLANVLATMVFVAVHLWRHPPAWALASALPSLVFGYFYERNRRLGAPVLLHAVYNGAYLGLLSAGS